jgi:hypothetical protein
MEIAFNNKLALHIPHFAWEDGKLIDIEYDRLKDRLSEKLCELGIDGWFSVPATGYYKGRAYEQEILTVFCNDQQKEAVIEAFRNSYFELKDVMRQEAFAYECNTRLSIILL